MQSIDMQFVFDEEKLPFLTWRPSGLDTMAYMVTAFHWRTFGVKPLNSGLQNLDSRNYRRRSIVWLI